MKYRILLTLLLVVAAVVPSNAQKEQFNPVSTAVNSLKIGPDARSGGMGDIGAATEPDANSQAWNPAKYPFAISRAGLAINYTPWLRKLVNDIGLAYVAGYTRLGDYTAISSSLRSSFSDSSGIRVRSHPISSGELMMHHMPKCVSSSSGFRPRPISSMSISL